MKDPGSYSLKEIREQDTSYLSIDRSIDKIVNTVKSAFADKPDQIIFAGCGSSYYIAATVCSQFIRHIDIPAFYLPCFELELNRDAYINNKKTIIIPFTRCSATSEVKSAITKCRNLNNVKSLAITCDPESSAYNDYMILCPDTEEKSIVMTRSFSSMVYAGMLMIDVLSDKKPERISEALDTVKSFIRQTETDIKAAAKGLKDYDLMVGLGQGRNFGIAGESSIKIKEMCLIPTEVYYTMEYRHGPVSIMNEKTVCMLYTSYTTAKEDLVLLKELRRMNPFLICAGENIPKEIKEISDKYFEIPPNCFPLTILPAQLLGVYWALKKKLDPDIPRNLSKAVVL